MLRILVIGGGIAGASAAFELASHAKVTLLEREPVAGYHTTGRSAALFSETYGNAAIRALSTASRSFFERPPEGFAEHELLTPSGSLIIGHEGNVEAMAEQAAVYKALTPSVRSLTPDEAIALVPILKRDWIAAAILEPDSRHMDVNAIHMGYLRGLKSRGGQIALSEGVMACGKTAAGWRVTTSAGHAFEADVVVNAAGAWADEVGALAGADPIGLEPKRRTAAIVPAPAGTDSAHWPFVVDFNEEFYFKPESGRILISPADETLSPPCDAYPEDYDVALAIDRIQQAADFPVTRVERSWAGLRSFVADHTPVSGFDGHVDGFYWLAAQGGYGIQTAPAMAMAASALVRGLKMPAEIAALGVTAETLSPVRCQGAAQSTGGTGSST
jgi:D-arginine dehydrogenase